MPTIEPAAPTTAAERHTPRRYVADVVLAQLQRAAAMSAEDLAWEHSRAQQLVTDQARHMIATDRAPADARLTSGLLAVLTTTLAAIQTLHVMRSKP